MIPKLYFLPRFVDTGRYVSHNCGGNKKEQCRIFVPPREKRLVSIFGREDSGSLGIWSATFSCSCQVTVIVYVVDDLTKISRY